MLAWLNKTVYSLKLHRGFMQRSARSAAAEEGGATRFSCCSLFVVEENLDLITPVRRFTVEYVFVCIFSHRSPVEVFSSSNERARVKHGKTGLMAVYVMTGALRFT